ncbi:MAG: family 16 glycoside hydrolase [Saprospiraceae bacterium]
MKTRTLFLALIIVLLGVWYFASKSGSSIAKIARPNDPWVFRSVMDKQPRMITFALSDQLWASYSTDSCSLYKIWSGSVDFTGAVYNMRHGPQPMSVGAAWFENAHRQPWSVTLGGKTESPRTDYKGHRYTKDGHAELMYDLVLADGQRIRINERPEYIERDRQNGFERRFTVENAPAGATVSLKTNAASVAASSSIETDGNWKQTEVKNLETDNDLTALSVGGELTLKSNGKTHFRTMFVNKPLIPNPFDALRIAQEEGESGGKAISPGERVMAKSDCRTCHNPQVQTIGPGYKQIAERYKNTPENLEMLSQKVMKGGTGVWGAAAMSPHPDIQPEDAKAMVNYVLSLDEGEDDGEGGGPAKSLAEIPEGQWLKADNTVGDRDLSPGLLMKLWKSDKPLTKLADINTSAKPAVVATAAKLEAGGEDFGEFKDNFGVQGTGYLFLEKDDNVVFQLASDDGSRLFVDGQEIINHDGPHGMQPKEAEIALRAGYHPIRFDYFQGGGGRGIVLKWTRFGSVGFKVITEGSFFHKKSENVEGMKAMSKIENAIPGDGAPLTALHPAYDLSQARPDGFLPKVAGMDFLPDGRLVVSTWDAMGAVYILENVSSGDPKQIKVKRIAQGLAEPLGLKVVDGVIYVLQKQELTKLVDTNGDDVIDEYQCFAKGWRASANFHEFAFGLVYKEGYFYAALAIAIMPGGASARPQIMDRGKVVRISAKDGSIEFIARGLRTPDGVGIGPDGEIFVADNQGDWLPSSKILHVKPGAFYNSFAVDSATVAQMPIQQPVVWLPQDDIGNSPTQPTVINDGPYKNQLLHGDVCYGGLQRVFMEKVPSSEKPTAGEDDNYQGCVFRFTQGLEGATHRLVWGPDGALYVGMIGAPGNWGQQGKLWYGLQRMKYNGQSVFEMLAVRAKTNGMEIEFTEPLPEGAGWDISSYLVKQWWYKPTVNYGGPKMDEETMNVKSATVSADRKKVFLEIPGLKTQHVVHIQLRNLPLSELGHEIWTTETWYTLNSIPADNAGIAGTPPVVTPPIDNTLTEKEKREGWQLLFDGKSTQGWHNYGKTTVGKSWVIEENALHMISVPDANGLWKAPDGGYLVSEEEYGDFELQLDWKIGPCGNSGIIYHVVEDLVKYPFAYKTGPEMQVLDNACHPDAKFPKHRAGDLYDLVECKYVTVKPAGEWNHVFIRFKNGKAEHWLNHRKVVELKMFEGGKPTKKWLDLIAGSKFPQESADFGLSQKGKIVLQDHDDPVWFKNIKIRKL